MEVDIPPLDRELVSVMSAFIGRKDDIGSWRMIWIVFP
jgi:hypothetical protein